MRVLVTGGRNFEKRQLIYEELDRLHAREGIDAIIEGGANGADTQAAMWATEKQISLETYKPSWMVHGNRAGPMRNQRMIDEAKPDVVIAFPGGRGTKDMIRRTLTAGIKLIIVHINDDHVAFRDEYEARPHGAPPQQTALPPLPKQL